LSGLPEGRHYIPGDEQTAFVSYDKASLPLHGCENDVFLNYMLQMNHFLRRIYGYKELLSCSKKTNKNQNTNPAPALRCIFRDF
jgi:hypothetical protein